MGFHKFHKFVQGEKYCSAARLLALAHLRSDGTTALMHLSGTVPRLVGTCCVSLVAMFFLGFLETYATLLLKRRYGEPQNFMEGWKLI